MGRKIGDAMPQGSFHGGTPPPVAKGKPLYLRWWLIVIVAVLALWAIGWALDLGSNGGRTSSPAATSADEEPDGGKPPLPTEDEIRAYLSSELGQHALQDACTIDNIAWACNVESLEPVSVAELIVTITQPSKGWEGVEVALAIRNFVGAGSDSPMPQLKRVVVIDPSGEELGRAE